MVSHAAMRRLRHDCTNELASRSSEYLISRVMRSLASIVDRTKRSGKSFVQDSIILYVNVAPSMFIVDEPSRGPGT
jgi:hypothetical protein